MRDWLSARHQCCCVQVFVRVGLCTRQVHAGSIVGACEMVDGGPRMYTVCADTFVELMVLEAERFNEIMKHFPKVMSWVRSLSMIFAPYRDGSPRGTSNCHLSL